MLLEAGIAALSLSSVVSAVGSSPKWGTLQSRTIPEAGGWSLSAGNNTCPSGSSTCFSDLTGLTETSNRLNNCCPSGTTPRLDCGTYVNTGQPYACCPLDNPDCRGDVEKTTESDKCANSGWALWYIPDGGYNSFCCLPDQYGYWYPALGQDAVGQCSSSSVLPSGALPGVQTNNGDGSVNAAGTQVSALPTATATPAPTCDVVHYGWSLQVNSSDQCTEGSSLCSYGGACCPSGLNCGTVIGASEVPVCCPPDNPDCRGDVEGLWPQVCADSSWALWHVNTNGNHFCCLPDQIGYNVPNDNAAVGFCGSSVPNGTMRSILDYVGDGSTPGSFEKFPCDSSPAANASYASVLSAIMNPPASLNPSGIPLATAIYPNATGQTIFTKPWATISSIVGTAVPTVVTKQIILYTTVCNGNTQTLASTGPATGIPTSHYSATATGYSNSGSGSSGSGSSGSGSSGSGSSGSGSSGSGSSGSGSSGSGSSGSGSSGSGSSGSGSSGSGSSGSGSSDSGSSVAAGAAGSTGAATKSSSSGNATATTVATFTGAASTLGNSLAVAGAFAAAIMFL